MSERSKRSRRFLLLLMAIATGLVALIVAPFVGGLFAGAVFAAVLFPLHEKLTSAFGGRARLSAGTLTSGLVIVVLLPLAWLGVVVARQVASEVEGLASAFDKNGTEGLIGELPSGLRPVARRVADLLSRVSILGQRSSNGNAPSEDTGASDAGKTGADATDAVDDADRERRDPAPQESASSDTASSSDTESSDTASSDTESSDSENGEGKGAPDSEESVSLPTPPLGQTVGQLAAISQKMLAGVAAMLFETFILVIALFFLLSEGQNLRKWVLDTIPLERKQTETFLREFHDVTVATFLSTVASAVIQAVLAAIGYLIAGTPLFFVALMTTFVAAFIPAVGGATIVVIVGVITWLSGSMGWGIFLILWGLLPVALSDNFAKPLLARGRIRLPGSVIFFSMLGGLVMFGLLGVVAGPLIVSFFLVVIRALGSKSAEDGASA